MLTLPSRPARFAASSGFVHRARLLADSASRCAVMLLGPDGTIFGWNNGAERLYGLTANTVLGRHANALHPDPAWQQLLPAALQAAAALGRHEFEHWHHRPDNTDLWLGCEVVALFSQAAVLQGYAWLATDLSARKRFDECNGAGRWRWCPETATIAVSPRVLRMLALEDQVPADRGAWLEYVHDDDRRILRRLTARAWNAPQPALTAELRLRTGDGTFRWFRMRTLWRRLQNTGQAMLLGWCIDVHDARMARNEGAQLIQALQACAADGHASETAVMVGEVLAAMSDDVRALQATQATLAAERERAHTTLRLLTDSVIITDAEGRIEYINPAAERMTGWPLAEAHGQPAASVLQLRCPREVAALDPLAECLGVAHMEQLFHHGLLRSRFGREFTVDVSTAPMHDANGRLMGAVMALHDVSAMHALLHTLAHQASHDSLTGLLNRREFEARLQVVLDNAQIGFSHGALIYLDLDQFKIVNDTCGHAAGDALLQELGRAYRLVVRERDAIARLGGDEFALVVDRCSAREAELVADKLLQATAAFRFEYCGRSFRIGVSIGVVPITARAASIEQLLRLADHACYLAKENGRHRVHVHREQDAAMRRRLDDMHWVTRLNDALRGDSLELYYQPIAPMMHKDGLLHYEILLRLREQDGNCIVPGAFLPAAERFDLMPAIDRWVLKRVLEWLEGEPEHVHRLDMATINLSRRTLADESFQQYAIACLKNSSVPPHKLCFEITENGAIADPARTIRFIETLKDRGCRFSLDDFGTGMTSFSYLKLLPVDFIKIDGSFVTMMAESPVDHEMVRFANEISHIMGRRTIAEYVSDAGIYESLRALEIDYAQGNWIGAPQPLVANMRQ